MNGSTKTLLIFSLSLSLVASCASTPPDNWSDIDVETEAAVTPIDCGGFPMPSDVIKDDEGNVTDGIYDKPAMNLLNDYRECSEANEGIANENALQVNQLKISRKGLTEAGAAQESISNMRQTMIEDERKHHFWSSIGQWALIIALGSAL